MKNHLSIKDTPAWVACWRTGRIASTLATYRSVHRNVVRKTFRCFWENCMRPYAILLSTCLCISLLIVPWIYPKVGLNNVVNLKITRTTYFHVLPDLPKEGNLNWQSLHHWYKRMGDGWGILSTVKSRLYSIVLDTTCGIRPAALC